LLKSQSSDAPGAPLLAIGKPVRLLGAGSKSVLKVDGTVSASTDVLEVSPDGNQKGYFGMEGLMLVPASGSPARHAIHLKADAGEGFEGMMVKQSIISQLGGKGIVLTAVDAGSLRQAVIEYNVIYGGIELKKTSDQLYIVGNTITGNSTGVILDATNSMIAYNNMTSKTGAIRLVGGSNLEILYNTIVQNQPHDAAVGQRNMVSVDGETAAVSDVMMRGNLLNGTGSINSNTVEDNLFVGNANRVLITRNDFYKGTDYNVSIASTASETDVAYDNHFSLNEASSVENAGTETLGFKYSATLSGSWLNYGTPYSDAGYRITSNGDVYLQGVIKDGATATGTVLFQLPAGFRPKADLKFIVASKEGAVYQSSVIEVLANGNVRLQSGTANDFLSLDEINFSAVD
jgi:hypothetical protein